MKLAKFRRENVRARRPISFKLERVCAIHSAVDRDAWQLVIDWFTSPFWHTSPHLTELLVAPEPNHETISLRVFQLAESTPSNAIRQIAEAGKRINIDPAKYSLADRFVFGSTVSEKSRILAQEICDGAANAVVIELDTGELIIGSLAAAMAWIVAESLRHGFPEEVTHGYMSLVSNFVPVEGDPESSNVVTALSLAAIMPLPGGISTRADLGRCDLAVPLPAYPLLAMVLPEHSAAMFPTHDSLQSLLADPSLDGRLGYLEPLGKWKVRWVETKFVLAQPFSRPVSVLVGVLARGLARSRDRVAASRVGSVMVPRVVSLGWVWSLLRRASNIGTNPWLTRASRNQLNEVAVAEVRK